jgi:hypothetical protein
VRLVGVVVCLLGIASCDRVFLGPPSPDAATTCHGTGLLSSVCIEAESGSMLVLRGIIDTSGGDCHLVQRQVVGPELCVLFASNISLGETFVAIGSRPLVLVATDTITVAHLLDVSSTREGRVGAGAQSSCDGGAGTAFTGGSGGAGGSFGFIGAAGRDTAVEGGKPRRPTELADVRGGCAGGAGGSMTSAVAGGDGGGAVYLIAANKIDVTTEGEIAAGGAGGAGGGLGNGGGGGGAGGLIALDAPTMTIAGSVFARGGGGGGGGGAVGNAVAGEPGADPSTATGQTRGGAGAGGGGTGGDGCGTTVGGIPGTPGGGGGGGGGGGCGIVRIYGQRAITGAVIPDAT